MQFQCPYCHHKYKTSKAHPGQKAKCKECNKIFRISDAPTKNTPPKQHIEPSNNSITQSSQPQLSKKKPFRKWIIFLIFLVILTPIYSWLRNSELRNKLNACPTYGIVKAKVYYEGLFSTDIVVFELVEGGSTMARRIDPIHLLLQFSDKLDLYSVRRVVLARNGHKIFYISSPELRELANSYSNGGRVWAFNHLPESICTQSGLHVYEQWTGGWLGVLQKQTEDLNDFITKWTGY